MKISLLASLFLLSFVSCYRMPSDEDYSVIPATNNPSLTHEKQGSLMPTMNY